MHDHELAYDAEARLGGYVENFLKEPDQMNLDQIPETTGARTQPLELVAVPGLEGFGLDFCAADFGVGDM
ncbi:hypothetical protein SLS58_005510 [Diplodia intermedia]|uniref:Uncharacterized protein n=1 Tax=Diplodia intermedia TaxID=856260 RepID=A0ABR3TQW6_9PEZI